MLQDCGAECGAAPQFRKQIVGMLEQGQTREQIIQHFVQEFGGLHVLGAPPDKGINRLAWAVPYGLGLAGAGVLGLTAWKLSKRSRAQGSAPPEAGAPKDTDLEDRLDDELSRVDS
jgi:cytochrome c-type biogenesis protein CcmH/NrfF